MVYSSLIPFVPHGLLLLFIPITIASFFLSSMEKGNDDTLWEFDLTDGLHIFWVVLASLAPAGFLLNAIVPEIWSLSPSLLCVIGGVIFWVIFPFALLSSISGESRLYVYRWTVLVRMVERERTTLVFYGISFLVIGCFLTGWTLTLGGYQWFLPIAAILGSACLIVYARLLGRYRTLLMTEDQSTESRNALALNESQEQAVSSVKNDTVTPSNQVTEIPPSRGSITQANPDTDTVARTAELIFQPIQVRLDMGREQIAHRQPNSFFRDGIWSFPFVRGVLYWIIISFFSLVMGIIALLPQMMKP